MKRTTLYISGAALVIALVGCKSDQGQNADVVEKLEEISDQFTDPNMRIAKLESDVEVDEFAKYVAKFVDGINAITGYHGEALIFFVPKRVGLLVCFVAHRAMTPGHQFAIRILGSA